jgi:predicted RNase H-like HicB family nuclease
MLSEYLEKAMAHAQLERMEDGAWFADIPGFDGRWASASTEQECRKELRDVLGGSLNGRFPG